MALFNWEDELYLPSFPNEHWLKQQCPRIFRLFQTVGNFLEVQEILIYFFFLKFWNKSNILGGNKLFENDWWAMFF